MPSYRIKNHRGDYLRRDFTLYGKCKPYTWVSAKHRRRADLLNIAEATRIAGEIERQGFLRVVIIPVPTPVPDALRRPHRHSHRSPSQLAVCSRHHAGQQSQLS